MHKIEDYLFKDNSVEAKRERAKASCESFEGGQIITIASGSYKGEYIIDNNEDPTTPIRNVTINESSGGGFKTPIQYKLKHITAFIDKHKTFISEVFRKSISQCSSEIEGETLIVKTQNQNLKEIIEEKANEKDLRLLEDYFNCFYSQVVVEEDIDIKEHKNIDKIAEDYGILRQGSGFQEYGLPKSIYDGFLLKPVTGERLDLLGEVIGISRKIVESENKYRERILSKMSDIKTPKFPKENYGLSLGFKVNEGKIDGCESVKIVDEASEIPKFEGKIQGFKGLTDGDTFNLHRPRTGQTFIENELQKFKEEGKLTRPNVILLGVSMDYLQEGEMVKQDGEMYFVKEKKDHHYVLKRCVDLKEDDRDHGGENKMFNVSGCQLSENSHLHGVNAEIDSEGDLFLKSAENTIAIYGEEVRQLKKFLNKNIHDDVYVGVDKAKEGEDKNIVSFFANVEGELKTCSLDRDGASILHKVLFDYLKTLDK
jgi:hypothetical protein